MTNDKTAEQLRACPWCGGIDIHVRGRSLECAKCGASGPEIPLGGTQHDMFIRWNTRADSGEAVACDADSLKRARDVLQSVRYDLQDIPSGNDCDELRWKLYNAMEWIDAAIDRQGEGK